jgi:hypothetical protein
MSSASSSTWNTDAPQRRSRGSGRKPLEIVGVVFLFFWFWPAAFAYLAWKLLGYPVPAELRRFVEDGAAQLKAARWNPTGFGGGFAGTGNLAFDEYRRGEVDRLERERRRLDDEAREFRTFVEDLKRAKDREEFDAYMAKRRQDGPQTV